MQTHIAPNKQKGGTQHEMKLLQDLLAAAIAGNQCEDRWTSYYLLVVRYM